MSDLMELEKQGWDSLSRGQGADFYDHMLTENAVMVVPGMVLDRMETLRSWELVPPWQDFRLTQERVVPLSDEVAVLIYHAEARRPGDLQSYRALCSSVYIRHREQIWRLAFHQQTPLP